MQGALQFIDLSLMHLLTSRTSSSSLWAPVRTCTTHVQSSIQSSLDPSAGDHVVIRHVHMLRAHHHLAALTARRPKLHPAASERRRDGLHGEVQRSDRHEPAPRRAPAPHAWPRPSRADQDPFSLSCGRMHAYACDATSHLAADRSIGIYASRPGDPVRGRGLKAQPVCRCGFRIRSARGSAPHPHPVTASIIYSVYRRWLAGLLMRHETVASLHDEFVTTHGLCSELVIMRASLAPVDLIEVADKDRVVASFFRPAPIAALRALSISAGIYATHAWRGS
jgi:hypothetical protein